MKKPHPPQNIVYSELFYVLLFCLHRENLNVCHDALNPDLSTLFATLFFEHFLN